MVLALIAAAALAGPTAAGTGASTWPPFAQMARIAQLVTLSRVTAAPGGGAYVFHVEQVYKGNAPPTLTFGPDDKAVSLRVGSLVVVLQMDRRYLDARGTIVWLVGPDERLSDANVSGQPATVAAMAAAFGLPATDTLAPTPHGDAADMDRLAIIVFSGLLAAGVALARRRPYRSTRSTG